MAEGWEAAAPAVPAQQGFHRHHPTPHEPRSLAWRRGGPRKALVDRAPAAAALLALTVPLLVAALVMAPYLAGGDSGQWVMLARAYQGEPVPSYRDPFAVPPAAPLLTLGYLTLSGDPYLAPKLALLTAFVLVSFSAFLAGRELFGWLPGAAAAAMVAVGQNFYLRLAVFGALPQLLSVAAFGLTLAALARWHREPTRRNQLYIALGAIGILLSHAPTAAVTLPVLALTLLLLPPRVTLRGPLLRLVRAAMGRVAPLVPAATLFLAYVWLKRGTFEAYLNNEAAFHVKGLGTAVSELLRIKGTSILLLAGGVLVALLLLRGAVSAYAQRRDPGRWRWLLPLDPAQRLRSHRAALLLGVPPLVLGVMMVAFHVLRIGTDYPRIFPLLGFPALISLAALVPPLQPRELGEWVRGREAGAFALAGVLLLPVVAGVVAAEQQAMPFYSVKAPDDLRDVLDQVEAKVPVDEAVWTPVREGKWLEGVTGRSALFSLPAWAIFRPWEWDRKIAGETLASGSAWISSGHVGALFQRSPGVTGDNPVVRVYYKGDLQPVLRVDDATSRLRVLLPGPADLAVTELRARAETVQIADGRAVVDQRAQGTAWTWAGQPVQLEVHRRTTLEQGGNVLTLEFHVRSKGAPLEAVAFVLRPVGNAPWETRFDALGATVRSHRHAEPLDLDLRAGPAGMAAVGPVEGGTGERALLLKLTPVDGPAGARTEAHGTLVMAARPVGEPAAALEALSAEQALDQHDVQWALFPRTARTERASAEHLGFSPVHENPTYTLYKRGGSR